MTCCAACNLCRVTTSGLTHGSNKDPDLGGTQSGQPVLPPLQVSDTGSNTTPIRLLYIGPYHQNQNQHIYVRYPGYLASIGRLLQKSHNKGSGMVLDQLSDFTSENHSNGSRPGHNTRGGAGNEAQRHCCLIL